MRPCFSPRLSAVYWKLRQEHTDFIVETHFFRVVILRQLVAFYNKKQPVLAFSG